MKDWAGREMYVSANGHRSQSSALTIEDGCGWGICPDVRWMDAAKWPLERARIIGMLVLGDARLGSRGCRPCRPSIAATDEARGGNRGVCAAGPEKGKMTHVRGPLDLCSRIRCRRLVCPISTVHRPDRPSLTALLVLLVSLSLFTPALHAGAFTSAPLQPPPPPSPHLSHH